MNRIFGLALAFLHGCVTQPWLKESRDVQMTGNQGKYKVSEGCENSEQVEQKIRQDLELLCGGRGYTITKPLFPVFPCFDGWHTVDIAFTCKKNNAKGTKQEYLF